MSKQSPQLENFPSFTFRHEWQQKIWPPPVICEHYCYSGFCMIRVPWVAGVLLFLSMWSHTKVVYCITTFFTVYLLRLFVCLGLHIIFGKDIFHLKFKGRFDIKVDSYMYKTHRSVYCVQRILQIGTGWTWIIPGKASAKL